ncbi:unnamed protein product, partial [Meganyctiphanes norvegica]
QVVLLAVVCAMHFAATSSQPEEIYHDSLGRSQHVGGSVYPAVNQHVPHFSPRLGPVACAGQSCQVDGWYYGGGSHDEGSSDQVTSGGHRPDHNVEVLNACGDNCYYGVGATNTDQFRYSKFNGDTMKFRMGKFDIMVSGINSDESKIEDDNMLPFNPKFISNSNFKYINGPNIRKTMYRDMVDSDGPYLYTKPFNLDQHEYNSIYGDSISTKIGNHYNVLPTIVPTINKTPSCNDNNSEIKSSKHEKN